jgi:hypothetical protein
MLSARAYPYSDAFQWPTSHLSLPDRLRPPGISKAQGSPPKAPPYRVTALLDDLKIHHMHRDLNFLGGETWYERVKAPALATTLSSILTIGYRAQWSISG